MFSLSLYIYIYIYIHVYMLCMYICMYVYIYIYIHTQDNGGSKITGYRVERADGESVVFRRIIR